MQWTNFRCVCFACVNEPTKISPTETTTRPTLSSFIPTSLTRISPIANATTSPPPTTFFLAVHSSATESSEAPDNVENAKVNSFANTNDVDTSGAPASSASFCSIPYALIVVTVILAASCDGFSSTSSTRKLRHRHRRPVESLTLPSLSQTSEQEQHQLNVAPVSSSPPPEHKRVPLPVMLAGGLFLFATSVQSSQRSRAEKCSDWHKRRYGPTLQ
jgi:hypothetical protein